MLLLEQINYEMLPGGFLLQFVGNILIMSLENIVDFPNHVIVVIVVRKRLEYVTQYITM